MLRALPNSGASMKRVFLWITSLSVIVIGAITLLWEHNIPPQLLKPVTPEPVNEAEKRTVPAIAYPLPAHADATSALPELDQSDDSFWTELTTVQRSLGQIMRAERMVRNIVVTVDNLPREEVSERMRPVKPVPGAFQTVTQAQQISISASNAKRYNTYVRTFESIDPDRLVAIYLQFYPLFQKAYQELGYPTQYFNDRLVNVIDHLLAAPEPDAKIDLVQPRVLYEFADRELQQASAGHKLMMRIGPENAKRVKTQLEKVRTRVIAASKQVRSSPEGR